jgi:hypothetical protein
VKITVRTSKLESVEFDAAAWIVDESGYLWVNDQDATAVATFAPGDWRYVMGQETP